MSTTFAEYAAGHLKRLLGNSMVVDVGDATVKDYQTARLTTSVSDFPAWLMGAQPSGSSARRGTLRVRYNWR